VDAGGSEAHPAASKKTVDTNHRCTAVRNASEAGISRESSLSFLLVGLVIALAAVAIGAPTEMVVTPPCEGSSPQPAYASVGAPPNVQIWKDQGPAGSAVRISCVNWPAAKFQLLIGAAGTFQNSGGARTLLSRFGAVSTLLSVRYWSTTDQSWRPLVLSATALTGKITPRARADFTSAELEGGTDVYLAEADSRGAGEVIYRMRVRENKPGGFIIETENVTPIRWLALTLLRPGSLYSVYFIEERSRDIWSYYSLTRIAESSWLIAGHEKSYVNRIVALYRHIAGIPTDLEPPAAR
jgi:hypothetical protein